LRLPISATSSKDQGKLKQIGQVIEKRVAGEWEELPDDLMGLPLVDMVNRLKQTWHEVKERAGYVIAVEEIAAVVTLLL